MMKSDLKNVAKKILGEKFDKVDDNIKEHNSDRLSTLEHDFDREMESILDRLKDKLGDLDDIDNLSDRKGSIVKAALENIYKSYNG